MSKGTVIKYEDSRGQDVFMVILGDDGEVATGIQLYPSSRRDSVPVYGRYALPSRLRFVYFNNIPDYSIDGYLSDSDLKALLAAVAGYIGLEIVSDKETHAEDEESVKTAPAASDARVIQLETEARIYKELYEALLAEAIT